MSTGTAEQHFTSVKTSRRDHEKKMCCNYTQNLQYANCFDRRPKASP